MKENPKNFIKNAIIGVAAITTVEGANAQSKSQESNKDIPQQHQQFMDTNAISKDKRANNFDLNKDSIPKFDFQKIYDQNKAYNDESFNKDIFIEGLPENVTIFVNYKVNNITIKVKIKHPDMNDSLTKETFTSLEDLRKKYPQYSQNFPSLVTVYNEYVVQTAWEKVLHDIEVALPDSIENYNPSDEEVNVLKKAAEINNNGGHLDGFDDILHYYEKNIKTPEDLYNFYIKYSCAPSTLAKYMKKKYFTPLLKNK